MAGITDSDEGAKALYRDGRLVPKSIILDPNLTFATPWSLWASTGVKAKSDAIEQLYCPSSHPVLEPVLQRAINWMADSLPRYRGEDPDLRLRCQFATWMSLFGTFSTNVTLGIGAGLRHQLAAMHDVAHDLAAAVLLPHRLAVQPRGGS